MGAGPGSALHPDALSYARVRAFGLPFGMLCSAMEGIFRGRGDTCATHPGRRRLAAARLAGWSREGGGGGGVVESALRVGVGRGSLTSGGVEPATFGKRVEGRACSTTRCLKLRPWTHSGVTVGSALRIPWSTVIAVVALSRS